MQESHLNFSERDKREIIDGREQNRRDRHKVGVTFRLKSSNPNVRLRERYRVI